MAAGFAIPLKRLTLFGTLVWVVILDLTVRTPDGKRLVNLTAEWISVKLSTSES